MQIHEAFELIKEDILLTEESLSTSLTSEVLHISKVGEYILKSGGKRFRPLVLLLSSKICGYDGPHHVSMAVVMEFLHTASLLHDDVVDNAELRRGQASANKAWGNQSSVLVGDYLLAKAFSIAVKIADMEVFEVLSETTTRMAEGEVMQILSNADTEASEEDYLKVITNKTAVLFAASARIPAILAKLSEEKKDALSRYGMNLGIAFQMMDDCLDYTSRDEDLGKGIGNDLKEGKITLPLIRALSRASEDEKLIITEAINADGDADAGDDTKTNEKLKAVMKIITKYDGIDYARAKALALIEDAKNELDIFGHDIERVALAAVADFAIERSH